MTDKPGKLTNWFIAAATLAVIVTGGNAYNQVFHRSAPTASAPAIEDSQAQETTPTATAIEARLPAAQADGDTVERPTTPDDSASPLELPTAGTNDRPGPDLQPKPATTQSSITIVVGEGGEITSVGDGVEVTFETE